MRWRVGGVFGIGWKPENDALDDEQEEDRAADRDRQIGHPDREEGKSAIVLYQVASTSFAP